MMAGEHPVERCAARCAEPAWRLAAAMLRDPHEAYDAVQQAFLVAARKPGAVPAGDPWPWFRVVVAQEAMNLRRKRRPAVRGAGAAPEGPSMDVPDPRTPSPSDAAARADDARRVADELERLDPSEREALLLVHVAELSHADAANLLGVARQTITERTRRGLELLGRRLGRPAAATGAILLAAAGAPPKGLEAATRSWVETAIRHGATGAATGTVPLLGGVSMAISSKVGASLGLVAALGVGFLGGGATGGFGLFGATDDEAGRVSRPPPTTASVPADPTPAAASLRAPDAAERLTVAEVASLRAENVRLAGRVDELERTLAARPATPTPTTKGPRFTFGALGALDAIRDADWPALGAASRAVGDAIATIVRHADEGTPVPKEVYLRLQEQTERMRTYEYRTIDRIPTAAKHNGEFTHPLSVTNLLAAALEDAGKPLSEAQTADFARLGASADQEFERLRTTWDGSVPRVRRVLDELRLKGRLMDALWAVLTDEQRPVWVDPAFRGVAGVDLFDATLLSIHTTTVVGGATVAEMRPKLLGLLRPRIGLAPDVAAPRLEAAVDRFLVRTTTGLEAVPKARAGKYSFSQAVAAGEGSVELVETLLGDADLPKEKRAELLEDPTWYLPRLIAR